jgi:hypothetical protein
MSTTSCERVGFSSSNSDSQITSSSVTERKQDIKPSRSREDMLTSLQSVFGTKESTEVPVHELKKVAKLWKAHIDRTSIYKLDSSAHSRGHAAATVVASTARSIPFRAQTMPTKTNNYSQRPLYNYRARTAPLYSIAEERSPTPRHCQEIVVGNDDDDEADSDHGSPPSRSLPVSSGVMLSSTSLTSATRPSAPSRRRNYKPLESEL